MAYAERLGLWGAGTSFADFKTFADTLEKRGVGALELLALELKSSGAYVSRGLAWQRCEFERWTCDLDKEASDAYDEAAAWWRGADAASPLSKRNETKRAPRARRSLRRALDRAITRTQLRGAAAGTARQRFWGTQLRFFREVQTAAKVPYVAERAKEAVAAGKSVVVGLQSTGEAGLRDVMAEAHAKVGDAAPGLVGRGALVGAGLRAAALSGTAGAGAPGGDRRRGRAEDPDDGPGPALRGARRALEGRAARGGRETGRAHPRARRAARRDPPAPRRLAGAAVAFR